MSNFEKLFCLLFACLVVMGLLLALTPNYKQPNRIITSINHNSYDHSAIRKNIILRKNYKLVNTISTCNGQYSDCTTTLYFESR